MKKVLFLVFVLGILLLGVVSAKKLISPAGVKYDSEIFEGNEWYKGFDEGVEWVPVLVKIKDLINISINYEEDSRYAQQKKWEEKENRLNETRFEILNILFNENFKIKNNDVGAYSFSGNVTLEGFEKLIKDSRVKAVYSEKKGAIDLEIDLKKYFSFWNVLSFSLLIILIILFIIKLRKRKK